MTRSAKVGEDVNNHKYAEQLERSGCTQVTEAQGCDIHKSKAENAKAGFGTAAPAADGGLNMSYEQKLERSGCTQVSELSGCDINKSKAENAAAGFGAAPAAASASPYAGNGVATFPETGATVANIRIDDKDQVWVNDKQVSTRKSDGALVFKEGMVIYTIQGDRRLKGEDGWVDNDAGTKGSIAAK
ncbi:hypothetical protein [Aeromonas caviae]|uniref:hypothetical protein n=1 Tax=Aeromonas TaxID=642 RepID=UPI000DEA3D62|nr:hypothetical protein [Aeromonas caviae]MDT8954060.1 hypothetical protein [Aeromonas caviae]RCE17246.1 hypothetical protein C6B42_13135 [Aeromonas caviae]